MSWIKLNLGLSISGPTIGVSPDFKELIKAIQSKKYIKKSRIENIYFPPIAPKSLTVEIRGNYQHGFYAFSSVAFEGQFGENPEVFMLYSMDDSPIEFDSKEHALNDNNLSIRKLEKQIFKNNKYEYGISKELNYYSNSESEYDIRPFIIVVFGDISLGFATITLINKSTSSRVLSGGIIGRVPGLGNNSFQPQARKLVWPTGKDLLRTLKEPQTGQVFSLSKKQVDNILALKEYFISLVEPKVADALKREYIVD